MNGVFAYCTASLPHISFGVCVCVFFSAYIYVYLDNLIVFGLSWDMGVCGHAIKYVLFQSCAKKIKLITLFEPFRI